MREKYNRVPEWMRKLPKNERDRAWAIYLFMLFHQGQLAQDAQVEYFSQCVERAGWPDDGLFPSVSRRTAERLGLDDPKWDAWQRFSTLRGLLRGTKFLKQEKNCTI